ncbi:MICOS complex subunit Mic10-like [Anoplophora glabripennis]|uniref:MICOS complex subunit Mic10-like n=1 Tax=Anoplophora glabripennis TaxID=217634 RepID=UPI0008734D22|nr:MICOS complex subunit Mic10-like [Anoplophora glabripennis]
MATQVYVEEELGRKWDKCFSDGLLKFGGGLVLGTVFSVLFFKRRRWPILMGGGFGIGMAYSNCEKDLNETLRGCNPSADKKNAK